MQIRFVEFGKRFIPYGSSDFIVLASSDSDIEKSVDYFRRAVLQFPKSTSFTDLTGNVSIALIRFQEGFLFVQTQSRREDEVTIDGIEPTMHRPFTQIRFSYLSSENLHQLLSRNIAVYTSLLYNNPQNNQKHLAFKLPDYGWFDKNGIQAAEKIEWGNHENTENELRKHGFDKDLRLFVNLLNNRLQDRKDAKRSISVSLLKDFNKSFKENFDLYYRLALLQAAQIYLYPKYGVITFALDHITEQVITVKFYAEDAVNNADAVSKKLPIVEEQFVEDYYQSIHNVRKHVFDTKLQKYFAEIPKLSDAIDLYRLTTGEIHPSEQQVVGMIRKYFDLLVISPKNEKGFPQDLYYLIGYLSSDALQKWINYENDMAIVNYLFEYLSFSPLDFITAYVEAPKNKLNQIGELQLGNIIPKISPSDLYSLKDDKVLSFWEEILNISTKKDLRFKSGESVILALLHLLRSSTSTIVQQIFIAAITKYEVKFVDLILNEIGEPTKENLLMLLQVSNIIPKSSTKNLEKGTVNAYQLLYKSTLDRVLTNDFAKQFDVSIGDKWLAFLRRVVQEVDGDLLKLVANAKDISEDHFENLIRVSSLIAGENIVFADWFFFHLAQYAIKYPEHFKKIHRSFYEQYPESKIRSVSNNEKNRKYAPFLYIISLGAFPPTSSLFLSLRTYYENGYDFSSLYYLVLGTWTRDSWCVDKVKISTGDIAQVINDLERSQAYVEANRYNHLLLLFAELHANQCKLISTDSAKAWLRSAFKSRTNPKTQEVVNFYTAYNVSIDGNKTVNVLFNILKEVSDPDAEFLWEISGTRTAVTGDLEKCQSHIRYWKNKLSSSDSQGNKYEMTKLYFDCALANYIDANGDVDGGLLSVLRKLIEVKYENITYSCRSQQDAYFLALIYEFAADRSMETLSRQFLEKYLLVAGDIEEKLMLHILNLDINLPSSLMGTYISNLISSGRFEHQIKIMGEHGVRKIYDYAIDMSAKTSYIRLLEERLNILNPSVKLRNQSTNESSEKAPVPKKSDKGGLVTTAPRSDHLESDQNMSNSVNESPRDKTDRKADNPSENTTHGELSNGDSTSIITIKIRKIYLVFFFFLLTALITLNIIMLWQYSVIIPELMHLMGI